MSSSLNLGDYASITAAVTKQALTSGVSSSGVAQPFLDRLGGLLAANIAVNFVYGSGGTTAIVVVRTRFDGVNWIEVARFDFSTASAQKVANLSGLLSKNVASVAALNAEGVNDGLLGPEWDAYLTTTGVYAGNTSVSVRLEPRPQ